MKLVTDPVVAELLTRQARPTNRVLALLDMMLGGAALIVECDDPFSGTAQVGDNEADARIQFAQMPFDLGNHAAGLCPTCGPIAEARLIPAHFLGRSADGAFEQIGDVFLQHVRPFVGAVHVAGSQAATLQVAELIKHEQWMIAGAAEVAVVSCAFLIAVGRAQGAVHVEHNQLRRVAVMNPVDPDAREVGQGGEVVVNGKETP